MIKVLIVDDIPETRDHLSKLLSFEEGIDVAGDAGSGEEAITKAMELRPDIVVMDINMPGMDGIAAAEIISQRLPTSPIIMMSVHGEAEQLKRSISPARASSWSSRSRPTSSRPASARSTSVSSCAASRCRRPCRPRRWPPRWMPPTWASTRSSASSRRRVAPDGPPSPPTWRWRSSVETNGRVCLVDANLQFGDVGVLLNLNPKNRSMLDAVDGGEPDRDITNSVVIDHSTGIRVLLAPPSPEGADLVTPAYLRRMVDFLRESHDFVVVDLPSALNDHSLAIMDAADQIVVLTALEITTIKNVRLFLEVADQLEYDRSKIRLVVNRSDSAQGIRIADVEASIRRSIDGTIVSDGRLAVLAVNRGVPFVVSHPDGALSRDITKLARTLAGDAIAAKDTPNKRGLFARR